MLKAKKPDIFEPRVDDLNIDDIRLSKKRRSSTFSRDMLSYQGVFGKLLSKVTGRRLSSDGDPMYQLHVGDLFDNYKRRLSNVSTCSHLSDIEGTSFLTTLKNFVTGRGSAATSNPSEHPVSGDHSTTNEFLPLKLNGELPASLVAMAERELGETPEKRQQAIRELQQLIHDEGKDFKTDEDILLMFLRAKKFDVGKAFRAMDSLYYYKKYHYDLHPYDPQVLKDELESEVYVQLRYRDQQGRTVGIANAGHIVPGKIDANEALTIMTSGIAKSLEEPANQIAGYVTILDCSNQSYKCLKYWSKSNAKMIKMVYLECMPARYKALHVLNPNIFFRLGYRISEMFLSKKLRDRVFVHGKDLKSLHKYVSPAILPPEYGGTLEDWKYQTTLEDFHNPKLFS